jgi:hypothetical protein
VAGRELEAVLVRPHCVVQTTLCDTRIRRTVIAKVPENQNQGYFAKTDFGIDVEAGTCT